MAIKFEDQVTKATVKYDSALIRLAGIDTDKKEFVITPQHIEVIHYQMVSVYGGQHGIKDNNLFLSICETPYQEVLGEKLYPTVYDKAAKFLESFAHYQVFFDGNKRTGLETMVVYLAMNNIKFDMNNEEAYDFVMDVALGKYQTKEIVEVIKNNSYITSHIQEEFEPEEKDYEIVE